MEADFFLLIHNEIVLMYNFFTVFPTCGCLDFDHKDVCLLYKAYSSGVLA